MSSCNDNCKIEYIATGIAVLAIWLLTLLILWILRRKNIIRGTKDSRDNCEMAPVKNEKKEDSIVYHQIAFSNGNRKPREQNPEGEVTYAQIKVSSNQDDEITYTDVKWNKRKKKENQTPKDFDAQTTYAEINPKPKQPNKQDEKTECYATVAKKKT